MSALYAEVRSIVNLAEWVCALALFLLVATPVRAAELVSVALDRNIISLGEEATLVVTFNGVQPSSQPALPALPNVAVGNVSVQTSTTIVNGRGTSIMQFLFPLRPTQMGHVTIPAMFFNVGGQSVSTAPLTLTVTKASAEPPPGSGELKLLLPKTSVYLGEPLPVEIALYVQTGRNPTSPQLSGDGFTVGAMEQQQIRRARLGNAIYNLVPFKTFIVPAKSGRLTFGPASITLDVPAPNARPDPFGRIAQWRRVTLSSESFELEVKPVPQVNVPATFNGAVGRYALSVTAGPTNLSVGDPITVRARLTGLGHLDSLVLPNQPAWGSFQVYPPNSSVTSSDTHRLSGHKEFEQVIIPLDEQISVLPPLQFSYFDVEAQGYRTLTGPAFPLQIRSAAHTARNVPALTNQTERQEQGPAPEPDDILHINPQLSLGMSQPLMRQGWFLGAQTVPILAWLGLYIRRRRREAFLSNPRLQRQREVAQRIRQGLAELRSHAQAGAADQFFATLFRLLQEQLGERLHLPASAITESVIDERLRARGLAEGDLKVLHELFQACNQARYAPETSGERMDELISRAETTLQALRALKV